VYTADGVGVTIDTSVTTGVDVTMTGVGVKGPPPQTMAWKALDSVASWARHEAATLPATSRFVSSVQMQAKSEGLQTLLTRFSKTIPCCDVRLVHCL